MIRYLIVTIVFIVIYLGYLNFRHEKFSAKERIKAVIFSACAILFASLWLLFSELNLQSRLREELQKASFTLVDDSHFYAEIDAVSIDATYRSAYQAGITTPRLELVFTFKSPFKELPEFFCNQREYQDFINVKSHHFYPTAEIKLPNNHFVGHCYPQSVVERVKKLAMRVNDFVPDDARYLFLPSTDESGKHKVRLYTENLEIETLRARIMDFIEYYQIISREKY